jgi:hypothetical protein
LNPSVNSACDMKAKATRSSSPQQLCTKSVAYTLADQS